MKYNVLPEITKKSFNLYELYFLHLRSVTIEMYYHVTAYQKKTTRESFSHLVIA